MPEILQIDRPGEVYAKGYAPKPAWERYGIHSPPLIDLLPPLSREPSKTFFFSVPSNIVDRSTAFVTGDPLAGSSYTILAGATTLGTPGSMEMFSWQKALDQVCPYDATTIFFRGEPEQKELFPSIHSDASTALREMLTWAHLRPEAAASLLGASRRSIYNWLGGGSIRDEFQRRIIRLREVLRPIADTRDPVLVFEWLEEGNPTPAALIRADRWDELATLVERSIQPLRPMDQSSDSRPDDDPLPYSADTRKAVLLAFSAVHPTVSARRVKRGAPELTGLEGPDEA